jgi:hypothetical protein
LEPEELEVAEVAEGEATLGYSNTLFILQDVSVLHVKGGSEETDNGYLPLLEPNGVDGFVLSRHYIGEVFLKTFQHLLRNRWKPRFTHKVLQLSNSQDRLRL